MTGNLALQLHCKLIENGIEGMTGRDLLPLLNGTVEHVDVPMTYSLGVGSEVDEKTFVVRITRSDPASEKTFETAVIDNDGP